MPKNRPAPPPKRINTPFSHIVNNYPSVKAIAATTILFSSQRIAVKKGQLVDLEFTPSSIVVHDPSTVSPVETNKLGVILYTHGFSSWDNPEEKMRIARETGWMSTREGFAYNLLEIHHDGNKSSTCACCGKRWTPAIKNDLADFHLLEHRQV